MIRLAWPDISFKEVEKDLKKVIDSGHLTLGPFVKEFEKKVADYVGVKFAVATTSATTALSLSLAALGIGDGDEVLVSDFTHLATGNVVIDRGAKPVLVDINLDTLSIDLNDLKKKITKKTKVVIVVDPFGFPATLREIEEFANKKGIKLIEDAATSIGAKADGRMCGSFGAAGCFSFHPRKTITTGEGGMITTNDSVIAEEARLLRNHGGSLEGKNNIYTFRKAGFNYRMSDLQAVLGIAQMRKIADLIEKRKKLADLYKELLSDEPLIKFQRRVEGSRVVYQSLVVLLDGKVNRNIVIEEMKNKGIETTLGTYALHAQPAYQRFGYKPRDLKNSYEAFSQSLALPLHSHLSKEDVKYICENLMEVLKRHYE